MNFYSVRSCGLASFFFFSFVARRNGLRGSRSPDSNGFHRFRYSSTEGDRNRVREREKERTQRVSSSLSLFLSLKNGHVHLDQLSRNDSIVSRMCINPSNTIQKFFIRPFPYDFTILCEYNETDFFKRKDANFSSFRV